MEKMNKFILFFCVILVAAVILESLYIVNPKTFSFLAPVVKKKPVPKPLVAYSFDSLKKTVFPKSNIQLGLKIQKDDQSFMQMFYYQTQKKPGGSEMETVSGIMNAPVKPGNYPVIIMLRGFVPQEIYKPGIGTEPVARELSKSGFITLAPDFLGFGQSSPGAIDSFENRFQTYTTVLSLLSSINTFNNALSASYSGRINADMSKIGIWAHSNGGHIALSALAISGVSYPTVLWAPVSTSFPYDILYYTDESDDQGKILRKILSQFESIYDSDIFSPSKYYNWIKAPIEIDQGANDMEVPIWWSDNLVKTLEKDKINVAYNTYVGADHNLLPSGWSKAVANDIDFFNKQFAK